MPSSEEQAFTTNFNNTDRLYIDLIRVTNIANTIESKKAFKNLMEQQVWQFGPLVRVDFVHDAKVNRPREDTTIAFVQFKLTIMHYHLARQFQYYMLHGHRLCFQIAGETNGFFVSQARYNRDYEAHTIANIDFFHQYDRSTTVTTHTSPQMVSRSTQIESANTCEQDTMTINTIEPGKPIANKSTNTESDRVLAVKCTKCLNDSEVTK
jgi:hypothetical protein